MASTQPPENLETERPQAYHAVMDVLESAGITPEDFSTPADSEINHVNFTFSTELSNQVDTLIKTAAEKSGGSVNITIRPEIETSVLLEPGGMTYAERDKALMAAAIIANSPGGSGNPGDHMPRGAKFTDRV